MADTADSKSAVREDVRVRIPPRAPSGRRTRRVATHPRQRAQQRLHPFDTVPDLGWGMHGAGPSQALPTLRRATPPRLGVGGSNHPTRVMTLTVCMDAMARRTSRNTEARSGAWVPPVRRADRRQRASAASFGLPSGGLAPISGGADMRVRLWTKRLVAPMAVALALGLLLDRDAGHRTRNDRARDRSTSRRSDTSAARRSSPGTPAATARRRR